ncbi:MAG: hypothetical protein ACT4OS_05030 [Acidimicrobiales bacterium]
MGQAITVRRKPAIRADVAIFELNRSLTGMGHERYAHAPANGGRPVDELARRLFATGAVEGVHVFSNVVTVDLLPGAKATGLDEIIGGLFTYYREGVEVADPTAAGA